MNLAVLLFPTLNENFSVVPNLGYFLTAAVTLPVWDWGRLRSKLHQEEYKQQQSKAQISEAQRIWECI